MPPAAAYATAIAAVPLQSRAALIQQRLHCITMHPFVVNMFFKPVSAAMTLIGGLNSFVGRFECIVAVCRPEYASQTSVVRVIKR